MSNRRLGSFLRAQPFVFLFHLNLLNIMKLSNRLSIFSFGLLMLVTLIMFLSACSTNNNTRSENQNLEDNFSADTIINDSTYRTFFNDLEAQSLNTLRADMATFILRKPDAAQWDTKFNPEFRKYYANKIEDIELLFVLEKLDTLYFYLIRDGRDQNGKANRGVGGKMVLNDQFHILFLQELFVTRIKSRAVLESIGFNFLDDVNQNRTLRNYSSEKMADVEWPDGRLFYSVEKSEWRYVN